MMIRNCFRLILFLLSANNAVSAQSDSSQQILFSKIYSAAEEEYGIHQELVNGLQYYNRNPGALGHPYLLEGLVHQGSVNLRGKIYPGLWLKYDIHDQHVEVEYQTVGGAYNQVILVNDRILWFTIDNYYFERVNLEEGEAKFYQVLGQGRMVWYIHWSKNLVPKSGDSRFMEEYTSVKRDYLLQLDGSLYPFTNKKSFVKLFPKTIQKDMKKLIKSNHIQIRSASTEQLELFLMAASNLLNGVSQ